MTNPVQELLDKHGITYNIGGRDFVTRCFNPEHDDSNPSFRIDRTSGVGHCFSCGFKFNIFKYYGVLTNNVNLKTIKLKEKLKAVNEQLHGLEFPDGYTPVTTSFRNISPKTLKEFGAFYTTRVEEMGDRYWFPISDITGKTTVFVGRHTLSNGNPRYMNYPRGVSLPLLPAAFPKGSEHTSMFIVEGIFDMLNLYDKGIQNSVCCFGTNTLHSTASEKLLPFKAQGITKVYIMFDGDDAGRSAAAKLKPVIEGLGFYVELVDLPDGTDPGDLSAEDVRSVKEYYK